MQDAQENRVLNSINMIRTFSCLMIAVFHVTESANAHSTGLYLTFQLASPGFHLFLLISGVVLAVTAKPDETPLAFFLARAVRIVPIYWVLTAVTFFMALSEPWLFYQIDLSAPSVISSFLFLPHANLGGVIQPILFVGWTLNYVLLFYLLFAVSRFSREKLQIPITIGLIIAVILSARFLPSETYRQFYGNPILLELAMGCALGMLLKNPHIARWAARTPMWPFALIGIAGLTISTLLNYDGVMKALTFGPAGAFLVFACAAQDLYRKPLKLGILNDGGKISYGVYLIHPLLLPVLAVLIFSQLGHGWPAIIALTTSVLTLTVFLAWLSMKFLEVPVNLWLRQRLGLNAARALVQREHGAVVVSNPPVPLPQIRKAA